MFRLIFTDTLKKFTHDAGLIENLWAAISVCYSSRQRFYHNLKHLDHIGLELTEVQDLISDWDVVVVATAYHDIMYNTKRHDNEERSADFAVQALSPLLPPVPLEKCRQLILATKKHLPAEEADINYFTDADLAILGAHEKEYRLYAAQIRKEYGQYPDAVYRQGRLQVIQHFLAGTSMYKTAYFRNKYEARARKNLTEEYERLRN